MRVHRAGHADRAEHERDERDDAEELLKVIQRVAEVFAAVVRRFEAPRRVGEIARGSGLSGPWNRRAASSRCSWWKARLVVPSRPVRARSASRT